MKRSAGQEFMERTKYQNMEGPTDQSRGLPKPPLEKAPEPGEVLVDLPEPSSLKVDPVDLSTAINERRSVRSYSADPLTLDELSYLLWCTQGVREVHGQNVTLRTVPSAGARHPFETYLLVNRVEGLEPGLYRFVATSHKLAVVKLGEGAGKRVAAACFNQYVAQSAVTFIWTADAYRTVWRYQDRSYRYIHLDAGHVCQNLYLAVQAVKAGCCAIGAFDDDRLNATLGLDGEKELAIYAATVGKLEADGR
ncbi:MAG: SagB/ThcOx family dehydrogenase [Bacillota bacterium]|nr:MAG: SagB/ThcOx family dehydrogenase [Bacillota bacterium]